MRGIAALLLASLLPVTFAMAAHAARHTPSYADWVRIQLREPNNPVVAQALASAEQSRPRTLEAFLTVFVEAYEAQQPEEPLAYAFAEPDLSNDALISYLQGRFLGFVGDAIPPRTFWMAAEAGAKQVVKRSIGLSALLSRLELAHKEGGEVLQPSSIPACILPVRLISAAQPRGP